MEPIERRRYLRLVLGRSLASLLDLAGVLAMGFLAASVALFVAKGSDSHRTQSFLGFTFPSLNIHILPLYVGITLLLFVLKALFSALYTKKLAVFIARVEARASRQVAEEILGEDLASASRVSKEWIYYLCTGGVSAPFTEVLNYLATIVAEGTLFLLLAVTFLLVDPLSTLAVLGYFAIVGFSISSLVGKRLAIAAREVAEGLRETQGTVADITSAFRELIVQGKRQAFFHKVEKTRLDVASNIGRQMFFASLPRFVLETAVLLGLFAFGAVKMLSGDFESSIATIGVFLTGSFRILAAMLPWQTALIGIKQSSAQAMDVAPYLREANLPKMQQKLSLNPGGRTKAPLGVELLDVEFSYSEGSEFKIGPISLRIQPGEQVAFIGKSGSGKSTIVDIIAGLREQTKGKVLLGGVSPKWRIEHAAGEIGFVPQKPGIISGTLLENILLETPVSTYDENRLKAALEDSLFSEVVSALPAGLQMRISEKDPNLSGGQLQRLGLARALYANPKILILDEATSALDGESEFQITTALKNLRGKVTVVLIAHRINTVQHSDQVFLVEDGAVVDRGCLSDLIGRNSGLAKIAEYMSIDPESAF